MQPERLRQSPRNSGHILGAMLGNAATSAMISGGMNVAQEVTGRMSQDVDRLAEKLADRAVKFYARQRWI